MIQCFLILHPNSCILLHSVDDLLILALISSVRFTEQRKLFTWELKATSSEQLDSGAWDPNMLLERKKRF